MPSSLLDGHEAVDDGAGAFMRVVAAGERETASWCKATNRVVKVRSFL